MDLPTIVLTKAGTSGIATLLGDWRTYFIVFVNGFVTAFAVILANKVKDKVSLFKLKRKEKKNEKELKELKIRVEKLEQR